MHTRQSTTRIKNIKNKCPKTFERECICEKRYTRKFQRVQTFKQALSRVTGTHRTSFYSFNVFLREESFFLLDYVARSSIAESPCVQRRGLADRARVSPRLCLTKFRRNKLGHWGGQIFAGLEGEVHPTEAPRREYFTVSLEIEFCR